MSKDNSDPLLEQMGNMTLRDAKLLGPLVQIGLRTMLNGERREAPLGQGAIEVLYDRLGDLEGIMKAIPPVVSEAMGRIPALVSEVEASRPTPPDPSDGLQARLEALEAAVLSPLREQSLAIAAIQAEVTEIRSQSTDLARQGPQVRYRQEAPQPSVSENTITLPNGHIEDFETYHSDAQTVPSIDGEAIIETAAKGILSWMQPGVAYRKKDIERRFEMSTNTYYGAMKRLTNSGPVVRAGTGRYVYYYLGGEQTPTKVPGPDNGDEDWEGFIDVG
jgi:hypothetical protein